MSTIYRKMLSILIYKKMGEALVYYSNVIIIENKKTMVVIWIIFIRAHIAKLTLFNQHPLHSETFFSLFRTESLNRVDSDFYNSSFYSQRVGTGGLCVEFLRSLRTKFVTSNLTLFRMIMLLKSYFSMFLFLLPRTALLRCSMLRLLWPNDME